MLALVSHPGHPESRSALPPARKFVSFSERAGPAGDIGRELIEYTGVLFEYWHDYRDGKLARAPFVAWMAALGPKLEVVLERAAAANIDGLSGSCADMLGASRIRTCSRS